MPVKTKASCLSIYCLRVEMPIESRMQLFNRPISAQVSSERVMTNYYYY